MQRVGSSNKLESAHAATATECAYARRLVQAYFNMLALGCQRESCTNTYCRSNPQASTLTTTEAAIMSIYLATQAPVPLCVDLDEQLEMAGGFQLVPEQPVENNNSEEEHLVQREETSSPNQELCPETSESEVVRQNTPPTIAISATTSTKERNSTPRRRLSTAVKLDNGLNKVQVPELVKRPTVITRVVVQPKHKEVLDPSTNAPEPAASVPKETEVVVQQQDEQPMPAASPAKDARQRRLSRPKQKLFDAIKRSFSRSRKTPLGST